ARTEQLLTRAPSALVVTTATWRGRLRPPRACRYGLGVERGAVADRGRADARLALPLLDLRREHVPAHRLRAARAGAAQPGASSAPGRAAEDSHVARPARDAVRVEALEQELRRTPAHAEQVAEARQRDLAPRLALRDEHAPHLVVGGTRHGQPGAEADEPPLLLEEAREPRVVHLHRLEAEACLELGCRRRPLAERACSSWAVELRALALQPEQRHDRGRPRLGGRCDAGIERVGVGEPALELRAELLQPGRREHPLSRALEPGWLAVEEVAQRVEADGCVHGGGDLSPLEQLEPLRAAVP